MKTTASTMMLRPVLVSVLVLLTRAEGRGDQPSPRCAELGRCSTSPLAPAPCRCDDRCGLYRDCCQEAQPLPPSLARETLSCTTNTKYKADLESTPIGNVYVVDRCPAGYHDNETRALCEVGDPGDVLLQVPVMGRRTGVLYKNLFCAVCGGVDYMQGPGDVVFWTIRKECSEPGDHADEIEQLFNDTASEPCQVRHEFIAPSQEALDGHPAVRRCIRQIADCPPDWDLESGSNVTEDQCPGTMDVVYSGYQAFRNRFCAQCHGVTDVSCEPPPPFLMGPMLVVPSYSLLLDLNMGQMSRYKSLQKVDQLKVIYGASCPSDHMYDVLLEQCRRLFRPNGPENFQHLQPGNNQPLGADCDNVMYDSSQFTILSNGSVMIDLLEQAFDIGTFELVNSNSSLVICQPSINMTAVSRDNIHDIIQSYLTLIGLILSLVCLAACIVAHIIFPALRNVPGRCVLGLSCSLFVAQLLFVTTTTRTESPACYAFALLIQYSFLAAFCWTNCLAFGMCRAFSQTHTGDGAHTKRYIWYSCYAWLTPMVAVTTGVVLNSMGGIRDELRPHYGNPLCWINRGEALLLVFVVPMALALTANIVMFILTTRGIYLSKKIGRQATKRGESTQTRDLVLYIKLSIIMGLTWVFGLLAALSKLHVFWYLFIVFNSLQGLLLFFSFLFTKKVKKLARDKRSSLATSALLKSFKQRSSSTTSTGVLFSTSEGCSQNGSVPVGTTSTGILFSISEGCSQNGSVPVGTTSTGVLFSISEGCAQNGSALLSAHNPDVADTC